MKKKTALQSGWNGLTDSRQSFFLTKLSAKLPPAARHYCRRSDTQDLNPSHSGFKHGPFDRGGCRSAQHLCRRFKCEKKYWLEAGIMMHTETFLHIKNNRELIKGFSIFLKHLLSFTNFCTFLNNKRPCLEFCKISHYTLTFIDMNNTTRI